jgi:RNA polymerase sigma-70 factor, ECF subfamily
MTEYEYITHQQSLTAFASTITRDWEDACDVVQDVFAECLRLSIKPNREYLFRSVRNRSLNVIRSRNRLQRMLEKLNDFVQVLKQVISTSAETGIIEDVLNLPDHHKEVVLLRIHSGLTVTEVASVLGIPEGTVKSRLNTALKILRKRLENRNND